MNVIYSPSGEVIGQAETERGAIRCARGIPRLSGEKYRAGVRSVIDRDDMPDFTSVWMVGPVLARTYGPAVTVTAELRAAVRNYDQSVLAPLLETS